MLIGLRTITQRDVRPGSRGSDGRWVDGLQSDAPIRATVRPARGREVQVLSEGLREREVLVVYTAVAPRVEDQHAGRRGTVYVVDGVSFRVHVVEPHRSGLISHWKATAVREDEAA